MRNGAVITALGLVAWRLRPFSRDVERLLASAEIGCYWQLASQTTAMTV